MSTGWVMRLADTRGQKPAQVEESAAITFWAPLSATPGLLHFVDLPVSF